MFEKRGAQAGAIINLQLTTGHAPKFARAASHMAPSPSVSTRRRARRLIELTIDKRRADPVSSTCEINQRTPLVKMCGYSGARIAALPTYVALGTVR